MYVYIYIYIYIYFNFFKRLKTFENTLTSFVQQINCHTIVFRSAHVLQYRKAGPKIITIWVISESYLNLIVPGPQNRPQTYFKSYPLPKIAAELGSGPIGFRLGFRDRTWIRFGPATPQKWVCEVVRLGPGPGAGVAGGRQTEQGGRSSKGRGRGRLELESPRLLQCWK